MGSHLHADLCTTNLQATLMVLLLLKCSVLASSYMKLQPISLYFINEYPVLVLWVMNVDAAVHPTLCRMRRFTPW